MWEKIGDALDFHPQQHMPHCTLLIDFHGSVLLVTEIVEGLTKIKNLLPGLARSNEFGFGNRRRDVVLTSALPREGQTFITMM